MGVGKLPNSVFQANSASHSSDTVRVRAWLCDTLRTPAGSVPIAFYRTGIGRIQRVWRASELGRELLDLEYFQIAVIIGV